MSIKRTSRPLQPDIVEFEGDEPDALAEVLLASTPRARIARIAKVLPDMAKELQSRLGARGSADNALLDDIEAALREAYQIDLVKSATKEHNRRVNLPTAEEQYARWREIAAGIRRDKPYLTHKTDIARAVSAELSRSHDPRDRNFMKPVDWIRKKI